MSDRFDVPGIGDTVSDIPYKIWAYVRFSFLVYFGPHSILNYGNWKLITKIKLFTKLFLNTLSKNIFLIFTFVFSTRFFDRLYFGRGLILANEFLICSMDIRSVKVCEPLDGPGMDINFCKEPGSVILLYLIRGSLIKCC